MIRQMQYPIALAAVFCLAIACQAQVKVNQSPADIKTKSFDPRNPPKEMPPLSPGEAAVTESKFSCAVKIEVEIQPIDNDKANMKITGITTDLELAVNIWLPRSCTAKIRAHENGHREISENFYKGADSIAKKIAQNYIHKEYSLTAQQQKDTQPVIQKIANEYCGQYLGQTEVPSEKVQDRYDALTDHGRNKLPEKKAIEQATKESGGAN